MKVERENNGQDRDEVRTRDSMRRRHMVRKIDEMGEMEISGAKGLTMRVI